MKEIGVGVIGTAFMGKAHSLAYAAAGTAFGDGLRPRREMVCDIDPQVAGLHRAPPQKGSICTQTPKRTHAAPAAAPG